MSGTLEDKRAATKVVKSLGLQAGLRARAVVLVAANSTVGSSLRDLIQLNEDDPALKALVEEFFRGEGTGKAMLCTDIMQFGKVLTADVSLQSGMQPCLYLQDLRMPLMCVWLVTAWTRVASFSCTQCDIIM